MALDLPLDVSYHVTFTHVHHSEADLLDALRSAFSRLSARQDELARRQ